MSLVKQQMETETPTSQLPPSAETMEHFMTQCPISAHLGERGILSIDFVRTLVKSLTDSHFSVLDSPHA
jgi:hypothetical protein